MEGGGAGLEPLRRYRQLVDEDDYEHPLGSLSLWPGGRLAANGMGRVLVWSRATGELLDWHETTAICRDGYPDFRMAFDPVHGRVADAHEIRSFALWDLDTWRRTAVFVGHSEGVHGVAFTEEEVLSVSGDGSIRRWDATTGEQRGMIETQPLYAIAQHPSRDRIAVAGGQGRVYVVDRRLVLRAEHELARAKAEHAPLSEERKRRIGIVWNQPSSVITALAWHPDGEHLVCGSWDFVPKLIHAETGRCVRQWQGHAHWVGAVAIDPEGRRLVTGSSDGTVRVWDLERPTCRAVFELRETIEHVMVDGGAILAVSISCRR